ncbi:hypothetical protein M885DRAFT_307710 [Pelagophyceae sp. CCMP2097]|nr:hypothetical protein M885DRAFT_307710 [Pelagophyceae sp. CCMP2097]
MRCVALACAAAVAAAPPPLFAESALSAAAALQRALPYDASLCRRAQGAKLVACTERESFGATPRGLLVERINAWLAWHVPFRRASDPATCARFCATAVGDEQARAPTRLRRPLDAAAAAASTRRPQSRAIRSSRSSTRATSACARATATTSSPRSTRCSVQS